MKLSLLLGRLVSSLSRRRAHPRTPRALAVDWRVFGGVVHCVSTTADVSPGGAFLHTADPKPKGTALILALPTSDGDVEMHARVAWSGPRGMGVRFMRSFGGACAA